MLVACGFKTAKLVLHDHHHFHKGYGLITRTYPDVKFLSRHAGALSVKIKADFVSEHRELASACDCRTSEATRHLPLKEGDLDIDRRVTLKWTCGRAWSGLIWVRI